MKGRDLIIYILQHDLEDEEIFEDGKIAGFLTLNETALRLNVGIRTVEVLLELNTLPHITIGTMKFIPEHALDKLINFNYMND